MVIYHFNRLIRNRFVWAAFAVIIAFAFVSVDSCSTSARESAAAGRVAGRKVPAQALRDMEHYIRQTSQMHDAPAAAIYTQAWERIAASFAAGDLGLLVSPEMIRREILSAEVFAQGFNINAYRALIRQQLNMSEREFEAGLANSIAMRMLGSVVGAAAWISPMEIDDGIAVYTDLFTAQHAVVSNIFANADIDVSDEEALKYYEAHRAGYALPDRVSVRYIAIPVTNYMTAVTVGDADVLDYYDSNPQLFTRTRGTNDTDSSSSVMTLEEARPLIIAKLQSELAGDAAYADACHSLLEKAVAGSLATVADSLGLPVQATPLFGADDPLTGVENAADLREKAFELDPARPETSFNAVRGNRFAYLINALSNDVARIPSFAEVADEARAAAREELRHEKFAGRISDLREQITAAMAKGRDFTAAAAAAGLTATTNYTFSISQGLPANFPEINTVVREIIKLRPGAVAASDTPRFGNAVIISLLARKPGDNMTAAFMRDQIRETMERRVLGALFADWTSWNLKNRGFVPAPGSEPAGDNEPAEDL